MSIGAPRCGAFGSHPGMPGYVYVCTRAANHEGNHRDDGYGDTEWPRDNGPEGGAREGLAAAILRAYYNDPDAVVSEHADGEFFRHAADVILRDWLPGALADERVVEAMQLSLRLLGNDVPDVPDIRAALTAAVTALREETL